MYEHLLFDEEIILAQRMPLQGWMIFLTEGADINSERQLLK